MKRCTDTIIGWMIQCNVINEEDSELYIYAIISFILMLLPVLLAVAVSFITRDGINGVILVLPFTLLRKFCGGYHAEKLQSCIIGSSFLLYMCMKLSMWVKCDWKLGLVTVIAAICLIRYSPIDTEKRKLEINERKTCKKVTAFLVIASLILIMLLYLINLRRLSVHISVGLQLTAYLQAPEIIKCKVNKHACFSRKHELENPVF